MKRAYLVCLFLCLTVSFVLSQSNPVFSINQSARAVSPVSASQADPNAQAKILDSYGKLPLRFEANHGQSDARVKFLSRTGGYTLFLTGHEAVARIVRDRNQLGVWYEEQIIEINRRHKPISYNPLAYSYLTLDPPVSNSRGIREYVHFHRHGEALQITEKKDAQGDIKAWDKIARTERDVRILSFGKGPIKPFQEDMLHRQLLQLVIYFEREQLTAEELAQSFDRYCACGKMNHETDALRKMRNRFEADLKARADLPE